MRAKTANPAAPANLGASGASATLAPPEPHTVAIVVFDGLSLFEFAAACEVFGPQDWLSPEAPWYRLVLCGPAPTVRTDLGVTVQVPYRLNQLAQAQTVLVPPCEPTDEVPDQVLAALQKAARRGVRILSLCTGAFTLAAAGLLDGRRATTHWAECEALARRHPQVQVDPAVLYIDEGSIMTSAGSAASIDLCLHVVRQDFGADTASRLAREMVVPPHRAGGQAQYIDAPVRRVEDSDLFADTLAWLQRNLDQPVTVAELADRSAMSRRTFARRFAADTGTTPYQWLTRQRLQLAQRLLETTTLPVAAVAERSGFVDAGTLRRRFATELRTSPHAYRQAFQAPATAAPSRSALTGRR